MAYYTTTWAVVAIVLLVVIVDQAYQRLFHKLTGEPPLFPYRIPIIGHALMFNSGPTALYKSAGEFFPGCKPYSLLGFGKRAYVITDPQDVAFVFRKSKALPFLPLIKGLSGLAWDISKDGMSRLSEEDETGNSIFSGAHVFYRDALKQGPNLDLITLNFLRHLRNLLDDFEATQPSNDVPLYIWSKTVLGSASTNAMMGPALLRDNPDLLSSVWLVEAGLFLFINKVPRMFANAQYKARDHVLKAFTDYLSDEANEEEGSVMIWDRVADMRARGISVKDMAGYSYAAYAAYVILSVLSHLIMFLTCFISLLNNANPTAYRLLSHIYKHKGALGKLRAEVAPVFSTGNHVTTLEQVQYLLTSCPLLRAFYDETLRMHALNASNRMVEQEIIVGGYTLKKGYNVLCPPYAQHNTAEFFGEDLSSFNPERFIRPAHSTGKVADPKMIRAFGGGVSYCPGRFFAGNEVLSYAASILWRFDIEFKTTRLVSITPRKHG